MSLGRIPLSACRGHAISSDLIHWKTGPIGRLLLLQAQLHGIVAPATWNSGSQSGRLALSDKQACSFACADVLNRKYIAGSWLTVFAPLLIRALLVCFSSCSASTR